MRRWLNVLNLFVTCCVGFVRYELWDGEGDSELCGVFGPVQDHLPEDCLFGLQVHGKDSSKLPMKVHVGLLVSADYRGE